MKKTTQQKGQCAQLKVELRATELGFIVSKPSQDIRYDFIIDDGNKLNKVQVKYREFTDRRFRGGSVVIDLRKYRQDREYCATGVDAFIIYIPQTDKLYWLPISLFGSNKTFTLRFEETKNNNRTIHDARDFEW